MSNFEARDAVADPTSPAGTGAGPSPPGSGGVTDASNPDASPSEALLLRPPQQARSRRTLEAFLDAARSLLEEGGEGAVTVTEVVARAGVSVGAFYARFEGRDDLIRYLGERSLESAMDTWTDEVLAPRATLHSALTRLAASFLTGPSRTIVLLHGHQDPLPTRLRRLEDRVARAIRVFDPFPSPPQEGDLLRALFIVAGVRELSTRAIQRDPDGPGVPKAPETLADIALSLLPGRERRSPDGEGRRRAETPTPTTPSHDEDPEAAPDPPAAPEGRDANADPAPTTPIPAPPDEEDVDLFDVWG